MDIEDHRERIVVADPEPDSRSDMCDLLRGAGYAVSEAAGGEEVLDLAGRERPRVVVLEVNLPGICGYHVCRRLRHEYAESVRIMFVSATRKEPFDRAAGILIGADDYLSKPVAADEFLARIGRLMLRPAISKPASRLTGRERDVLALLAEGLRQKEIGRRLVISDKTVGTHVEHIFSKLGVHNRLQAVAFAHRHRLLEMRDGQRALV